MNKISELPLTPPHLRVALRETRTLLESVIEQLQGQIIDVGLLLPLGGPRSLDSNIPFLRGAGLVETGIIEGLLDLARRAETTLDALPCEPPHREGHHRRGAPHPSSTDSTQERSEGPLDEVDRELLDVLSFVEGATHWLQRSALEGEGPRPVAATGIESLGLQADRSSREITLVVEAKTAGGLLGRVRVVAAENKTCDIGHLSATMRGTYEWLDEPAPIG